MPPVRYASRFIISEMPIIAGPTRVTRKNGDGSFVRAHLGSTTEDPHPDPLPSDGRGRGRRGRRGSGRDDLRTKAWESWDLAGFGEPGGEIAVASPRKGLEA